MAEIKNCATCKYQALDGDEEPCVECKHAYEGLDDMYEPMERDDI